MISLNLKNIRLFSLFSPLFVGLFLSGCITQGTSEPGYFMTVADKSDLIEKPNGYGFSLSEFHKKHGKSIISSDATTQMKINYVESGDKTKPAIIFVHGTPGGWGAFWPFLVMTDLKNNANLVSIDRPGWGNTTCNTNEGKKCFYPLLKRQSKYLDTLIKKLDEQNNHQGVILVGHSLGGPLIGQMALDYPEYVRGLVFIASPFDAKLSNPRWYNWMSHAFAWVVPKDLKKANKEMMPLCKQLKQMKNEWASINAPIWVIQGSKDDLVNRKNLDYSRTLFSGKNAQFIEVKTSGHFVLWEKKSIVVESINQALKTLRPETVTVI